MYKAVNFLQITIICLIRTALGAMCGSRNLFLYRFPALPCKSRPLAFCKYKIKSRTETIIKRLIQYLLYSKIENVDFKQHASASVFRLPVQSYNKCRPSHYNRHPEDTTSLYTGSSYRVLRLAQQSLFDSRAEKGEIDERISGCSSYAWSFVLS